MYINTISEGKGGLGRHLLLSYKITGWLGLENEETEGDRERGNRKAMEGVTESAKSDLADSYPFFFFFFAYQDRERARQHRQGTRPLDLGSTDGAAGLLLPWSRSSVYFLFLLLLGSRDEEKDLPALFLPLNRAGAVTIIGSDGEGTGDGEGSLMHAARQLKGSLPAT